MLKTRLCIRTSVFAHPIRLKKKARCKRARFAVTEGFGSVKVPGFFPCCENCVSLSFEWLSAVTRFWVNEPFCGCDRKGRTWKRPQPVEWVKFTNATKEQVEASLTRSITGPCGISITRRGAAASSAAASPGSTAEWLRPPTEEWLRPPSPPDLPDWTPAPPLQTSVKLQEEQRRERFGATSGYTLKLRQRGGSAAGNALHCQGPLSLDPRKAVPTPSRDSTNRALGYWSGRHPAVHLG